MDKGIREQVMAASGDIEAIDMESIMEAIDASSLEEALSLLEKHIPSAVPLVRARVVADRRYWRAALLSRFDLGFFDEVVAQALGDGDYSIASAPRLASLLVAGRCVERLATFPLEKFWNFEGLSQSPYLSQAIRAFAKDLPSHLEGTVDLDGRFSPTDPARGYLDCEFRVAPPARLGSSFLRLNGAEHAYFAKMSVKIEGDGAYLRHATASIAIPGLNPELAASIAAGFAGVALASAMVAPSAAQAEGLARLHNPKGSQYELEVVKAYNKAMVDAEEMKHELQRAIKAIDLLQSRAEVNGDDLKGAYAKTSGAINALLAKKKPSTAELRAAQGAIEDALEKDTAALDEETAEKYEDEIQGIAECVRGAEAQIAYVGKTSVARGGAE
jgi:hypothetical protein